LIEKGGENDLNARKKQMIRVLRELGKGYKSIAKDTGLSSNAVRCYCRYHGLAGNASKQMFSGKAAAKSKPESKPVSAFCRNCGKEIYYNDIVSGRKRKFCNEQCRYAYWNGKKHTGG